MFLVLIQTFCMFCVIKGLLTKSEAGITWDMSLFEECYGDYKRIFGNCPHPSLCASLCQSLNTNVALPLLQFCSLPLLSTPRAHPSLHALQISHCSGPGELSWLPPGAGLWRSAPSFLLLAGMAALGEPMGIVSLVSAASRSPVALLAPWNWKTLGRIFLMQLCKMLIAGNFFRCNLLFTKLSQKCLNSKVMLTVGTQRRSKFLVILVCATGFTPCGWGKLFFQHFFMGFKISNAKKLLAGVCAMLQNRFTIPSCWGLAWTWHINWGDLAQCTSFIMSPHNWEVCIFFKKRVTGSL